ncbi:hypothetical protein Tco_1273930 [Tanacetum coccineum]
MSLDSASSEVTYTSISSHGDPLAWAVDFFGLQEPDSPEAAPPSPNYVPGPEEPEQAPLSPDYVPGPEHPPSPVEVPCVPEPDPISGLHCRLGPQGGPRGRHLTDDDDDTDDEDEEPVEDEDDDEEEEEHLAPADSSAVPVTDLTCLRRARKTVRLEPPMLPSMEARIAEYAAAPT